MRSCGLLIGEKNMKGEIYKSLVSIAVKAGLLIALLLATAYSIRPVRGDTILSSTVNVDPTTGVIIAPTNFLSANISAIVTALGTNVATFTALSNALGQTAPVTFSLAAGTYLTSATVSLACATPNSSITYTLNGSTPTASNGTLYTGTITLTNSATIKAYATSYYRSDANVTSAAYTITSGTKVYYGRSSNTSLTGAQVEALTSVTRIPAANQGINGSYSFSAGTGYYYIAWLFSFDDPLATTGFVINGVPVTMADASVSYNGTVVNGWTYQTATAGSNTYKVFRSAYPLTGANNVILSGSNYLP